jgi:hypothetical protein
MEGTKMSKKAQPTGLAAIFAEAATGAQPAGGNTQVITTLKGVAADKAIEFCEKLQEYGFEPHLDAIKKGGAGPLGSNVVAAMRKPGKPTATVTYYRSGSLVCAGDMPVDVKSAVLG